MSAPLVSVVIPTRNRAGLLPTAIRSALDQTFRDLEVIVVDDASDDGTSEAVASFSDSRVKYFRQPSSRGGAAARNEGIRRSRGELVAFLDDDDEWFPEKVERQVARIQASPPSVGVVYCSYLVVDRPTGEVIGRKSAEQRGDLRDALLARNVVGATSCVMLRRICLGKVGLFDENLPSFHDYDLWIRLSREYSFDFVGEDLLRYFVHPKKIWNDLDALTRGIDRMFGKYGDSPAHRRNLSGQSLGVGVRYCFAGDCAAGRRALRRAMRLYAFEPRHYLNFGLSFFGAGAFRTLHDGKRRLFEIAPWNKRPRALGHAPEPGGAGESGSGRPQRRREPSMIEGSSFRRDRAPSGPGRSTQKANGRSLGVVLYEPSGRGGVCHYTYRLAEALAAEGCRVTLVTTRDYELEHLPRRFRLRFLFKPSAVKRFLSSATSRVARRRPSKTASGPPPAPSLRRPPILVALRTLRVRLLQFLLALELLWRRPDVVHFQLVSPARDLFLIRLLLRLGLPVVYTAHDVLPQDPRSAARWSSHAKVYGLVDRLVVHAESDRREMVTLFGVDPRKISVIAHGSYDFLFPEGEIAREDARRRVGFPAEARIVLFFGLIKRYKGLEFLVEAFRRVRDRVPDALLAVVGGLFRDADGYDFYRRLLDEICEDPRTLCVPKYVPLEDVGLYLSAADVIVLPYTKIYQSGVLLAAYAAGRPVVATSTGGLPEVVEHGRSGLVVPPRDPEALASALVDLLEDLPRAVAMGKRALELGRTRYSWDGIAEQTANLYRAILEERRAGGGQTVSRVLPVLDPPPPERSGQVRR